MIAILGDVAIIGFLVWTLLSERVDVVPFAVCVAACAIGALNIMLILLGSRVQQRFFKPFCQIAIGGNWAILGVLGFVGTLGVALGLGGGLTGNGLIGVLGMAAALGATGAMVFLNLWLIKQASTATPPAP